MADLILRDYQKQFVDDVGDAWSRTRSVIGWMPTGAGKTEVAVHYALLEQRRGGCTLFIVDRKTLAGQARNRYGATYGMLTGLIRGEDTFVRGYEPVLIATVQTLKARWEHAEVNQWLERITLVVIDEAHIKFRHHEEIITHLPKARVLGLSATPIRDGLGLIFGELVKEGPRVVRRRGSRPGGPKVLGRARGQTVPEDSADHGGLRGYPPHLADEVQADTILTLCAD